VTNRAAHPTALRTVALIEGGKGLLVFVVGCGLLALVHRDLQENAEAMVRHFHLNPASRYPRIFVHAASALTDVRLWFLAAGAAAEAGLRFVEAYGLWQERRWAKWLAAFSSGIYLPIEIYELLGGVTWLKLILLLVNAAIVACMVYSLGHGEQDQRIRGYI